MVHNCAINGDAHNEIFECDINSTMDRLKHLYAAWKKGEMNGEKDAVDSYKKYWLVQRESWDGCGQGELYNRAKRHRKGNANCPLDKETVNLLMGSFNLVPAAPFQCDGPACRGVGYFFVRLPFHKKAACLRAGYHCRWRLAEGHNYNL